MPTGLSPQVLKRGLGCEYLFYRNSLRDWSDHAGGVLGQNNPAPMLDHGAPEPFLSVGLGVPGIRVDDEAHYFGAVQPINDSYPSGDQFILEWAGVLGQPRSEFSTDGAIYYNPMTLIGSVANGWFVDFRYPGEIAIDLGNLITSANPGNYYAWYANQPLHLVVIRSSDQGQGASEIRVYVNGCRVEMTGTDAGIGGFDVVDATVFNIGAAATQACFGIHFLLRGWHNILGTNHDVLYWDDIANYLFSRTRDAFPTLRWPIPEVRYIPS